MYTFTRKELLEVLNEARFLTDDEIISFLEEFKDKTWNDAIIELSLVKHETYSLKNTDAAPF